MIRTLYKKDSKGFTRVWSIEVIDNTFIVSTGLLNGKQTVTTTVCEAKNVGRSNVTTPEQQAQKEADAKYRIKMTNEAYQVDANCMSKPKFVRPMLALDATKVAHRIDWENKTYVAQPKLNGVRCIATYAQGEVIFTSRKGKVYTVHDEIEQSIIALIQKNKLNSSNIILDGELYIHHTELGDVTKAVANQHTNVEYRVFDLVMEKTEFVDRYRMLHEMFQHVYTPPKLKLIDNKIVPTWEDLIKEHKSYVAKGYEGLILRDIHSEYQLGKKTVALFKYKTFQDAEFKVIDVEKDKNGGAILILETPSHIEFKSRPMGTDTYRKELYTNPPIGKLATVKYSALLASGIPEFNRTILIRTIVIRDYE